MLLSEKELKDLAFSVFTRSNTSENIANIVADSLVLAELDGIHSHGFARIPFYADQAICGKVNGHIAPTITEVSPSGVYADAHNGFAFPAIELGLEKAITLAQTMGIAMLGVGHSHHCGVAGQYVEKIARENLIGIMCSNTPSAMAPWGGSKATFGTNPLAFSCPRKDDHPLVIDMSLSKVARGKIQTANQQGKTIPDDWAIDAEGKATTDPAKALAGSMLPIGGAKGASLALMIELLSVAVTGSSYGYQASSFFDNEGGSPNIGQFFIIINPFVMNNNFLDKAEELFSFMLAQEGVRLPGARRFDLREKMRTEGVELPDKLYANLTARIG